MWLYTWQVNPTEIEERRPSKNVSRWAGNQRHYFFHSTFYLFIWEIHQCFRCLSEYFILFVRTKPYLPIDLEGLQRDILVLSVLLVWEEREVHRARLVWVQESPSASQRMQKFPKCKLHKDLGTLLQNAASLTSIHSCCGASGIPKISTALPSQTFWHMEGFEDMAVLCDPT